MTIKENYKRFWEEKWRYLTTEQKEKLFEEMIANNDLETIEWLRKEKWRYLTTEQKNKIFQATCTIIKEKTALDFWSMIHEDIVEVSKNKFEDGYYADSVESAFKEINTRVKKIVRNKIREELDGKSLMNRAFSSNKPIIVLDNLSSETGKNIQQGYMQIFAGAMIGIRNPKAHENITIDIERAIHFIFLASLLMNKLDEAKY